MSELISRNPATGAVIWCGVEGDVAAAIKRARPASMEWAARPLEDRIEIARRFRDEIVSRAEPFARLIAEETGKPLWEAKTEVQSCAAKVEISITAQAERAGTRVNEVAGAHQALRHKPHGVLAVLGPYNFPAHLPNGHIVPALLAGNAVIFKPSEKTPATGEFMRVLWQAAGLPEGVLQVVQGGPNAGRQLVESTQVDGVLFTGSAQAGAAIHRTFSDTPHRMLAIEAGGNNPLIAWNVGAEDLEAAARIVVQSAFLSAGQRCTCARRLIVGQGAGDLVQRVVQLADQLIVGDAFSTPEPFMGPVIDNAAADALEAGYAKLVSGGAKVLLPLRRVQSDQPFLTPAVVDVTGIERGDEELFGPILQVIRVSDFEEAITEANATRFGLSAALIGGDKEHYETFWAQSKAGIVNWNKPTTGAASNAPFGGIGASGNHRPSAYYAADYCAWPVAGIEASTIDVLPIKGLQDAVNAK